MPRAIATQFRELLEHDLQSESGIVISFAGKIAQTHYAARLGCSSSYLTRHLSHVLDEFQSIVGNVSSNIDLVAPSMRAWVLAAASTGDLDISQKGIISRVQLSRQFNLSRSTLSCYSKGVDLCEKLDALVPSDYLPRAIREKVDRLRSILDSSDCPIEPVRNAVSHAKLSVLIGVRVNALARSPYREFIDKKDEAIRVALYASTIDPYLSRTYRFSDLASVFPLSFLESIASVFKDFFGKRSESYAVQGHSILRQALLWVAEHRENEFCQRVMEAVNSAVAPSEQDWYEALRGFCDEKRSAAPNEGPAHNRLLILNLLVNELAQLGIVPPLANALTGSSRRARRGAGRRKTVAEIGVSSEADESHDYATFARHMVFQAAHTHGITMDGIGDFVAGVASDAEAFGCAESTHMADAILNVINRRLDAIQAHAKGVIDRWYAHYCMGAEHREAAFIDPTTYWSIYCNKQSTLVQQRRWIKDNFRKSEIANEGKGDSVVGNLLAIVDAYYGGIAPGDRNAKARAESGTFFIRLYALYGGIDVVDAYSAPHSNAYYAALTLYLCESGANVAVGRTLTRDCIQPSEMHGYELVTGHKARAGGKPIFAELPSDSTALGALKWILVAGENARAKASPREVNLLFARRDGERCKVFHPARYADWFKKFCADIPGLSNVKLLPSMIRPSVLLKAALERNGRIAAGVAIGQHGESVSQGYQNKWPTRLLYDSHIRGFQKSLEAVIVRNISGAAERIGIPPEEFRRRLETLDKTGFGTFCADRMGHPREIGRACTTMDCWNDCPQMVFVAEVEAVATLQLWQASLRQAQSDWERDRSERWEKVWMPWLCLTDVIEEKMARGPLLVTWQKAEKRRAEIMASPSFIPPRPW